MYRNIEPYRGRSMFTKIMGVVIAVTILLTTALTGLSWIVLRNQTINARLELLTTEAREIAYLAAQENSMLPRHSRGGDDRLQTYMRWKTKQVYQDFGAYIVVVDRFGRAMDNLQETYADDPDFVYSLDGVELRAALLAVLGGEEIAIRTMVRGNPTFMVGVPFVQDDVVLGAVLIQTKAQVIEGGMSGLVLQAIPVVLAALSAAASVVFLYVRMLMRPLNHLTHAARSMAEGRFDERVEPEMHTPEIAELSIAFNSMADRLGEVESSRREFVANVSHELRSPITSIRGFVQGMEDGTIPPEEHTKYLALVGDETRRLSKLIGDLLALSRLERDDTALDWTRFDINEMLRRAVIRRVNDLEDKQMEIECVFQTEPCMVRADSDRIEQVVVNLLDNAIKFTPAGGRICLRSEVTKTQCLVTVEDNGVGISPEDRSKIFDRFFTADRAHTAGKGTGLGLSICQRIMEMHGQSIRLKDVKAGAAFVFTLEKAG